MPRVRPNILMIMADQLPAWTTGIYGHPTVQTPNIDGLAERGVTFESAYANCPLCGPSRASMCTGRMGSDVGVYDNGGELSAELPTFIHHLRRAGYETLLSGKMHFVGPDQHHGFERRLTTEIYPSSFVWTPDWRKGAYANPGTAVDQILSAGRCDWSMQLDYDEEVHFRSLEALRDLSRRRNEDRPFFLCASYTHPHDPFIINSPWWDMYDHDAVTMPTAPALPLAKMHQFDQWLQIHHMVDKYPIGEREIRNARHAFYGMVSYFDAKVGELVQELVRLGMAQDTVVIVTSDHGEMLGEHGMWFKRTYFDESTRVPLLISGPGVSAGARVGKTVSLIDLFPTFLELAGSPDRAEIVADLPGDSLSALLRGEDADWRDYAIGEYCGEGTCQPMRMAVSAKLKYVFVNGEQPLLFDLAVDPHELHNRIDDKAYAERLATLQKLVHDNWDAEGLRADVIESQTRRRYINEAMKKGLAHSWDARPDFDAASQYVRKHDAKVTSSLMRIPKVDDSPDA